MSRLPRLVRRTVPALLSLGLLSSGLHALATPPSGSAAVPGAASLVPAGTPVADSTPGLPNLDKIDPARFSYEGAVVEHFQVPSRDGISQIWVDVIRPDTSEKVPTIMMASPYFNTNGRGYLAECKTPHQTLPADIGAPACAVSTPFPEWYDEYFVPRGYAFAAMDLRGTRNSSGCQTYGDRDEVFDAVDVVDFLAEQDWSNGKIGMTGGSYDGTIATGAAAEAPISGQHPEALAAIIPIRAIDAWYDYHFFNGAQSSAHAATPALFTALNAGTDVQNSGTDDVLFPAHVLERKACIATFGALVDAGYAQPYQDARSPFWAERDFEKDGAGITAATFLIHGLFDFNVKPHNAGWMHRALPKTTPKKLWWLNGDHFDPRCPTEEDCQASSHLVPFPLAGKYVEWNHRWWLQFLKGKEAGALAEPVAVQRNNGRFDVYPSYPSAGSPVTSTISADGALTPPAESDEAGVLEWDDSAAGDQAPAFVDVLTEPFTKDTRISGQLDFDLLITAQGPDTTIAVEIADVPPGAETDAAGDTVNDREFDGPLPVTYGWLRAFYRDSVAAGPERPVPTGGAPLTPGTPTRMSFSSMHTDHVFTKGHRLRLRFSNAASGTLGAMTGLTVSMGTGADGSTVTIPYAPLSAGRAPVVTRPPAKPLPPAGAPRPVAPAPKPRPLPATGAEAPLLAVLVLVVAAALTRRRRTSG